MTERDLFFAALDVPAADRGRFLDERCGGDAGLRRRVEGLLAAHAVSGGFLDGPPDPDATTALPADPETTRKHGGPTATAPPAVHVRPGTVVAGRYKLLQPVGEGGMGTVWMAEQTEPVRRKVAVKLIRGDRGGSAAVLARFEAERQAIALMDHPHIARLFDAGADGGGPFFVMELVKGVPITDFCDTHRLGVRDRLALFGQVCGAVQHAHQKGVIYRDLKPSNVLVESHDGRPVPKVIDFGLAKATGGLQLTEATLFTGFGAVLGTPLYMAPEQATFNAVDVDTRADVYALGVILYELLTGTTPIDRKQLGKAALEELLRVIREDEPPTPSSRLSTGDGTPSAAAVRDTEPAKLGRLVKGELDWVVMKALAKDRDRRYESAAGFARDVERFLNHEPVAAGPPSAGYRVRKFVRRHRRPVVAAGLLLLALVAGLAGTGWGLVRAERAKERERADAERQARLEAVEARNRADAERARAVEFRNRALEALRAATSEDVEKLFGEKKALSANETAYLEAIAGRWAAFARDEDGDEQSRAVRAEGHYRIGGFWDAFGQLAKTRPEYERAIALRESLAADFPAAPQHRRELGRTYNSYAVVLTDLGEREEAVRQHAKAQAVRETLVATDPAAADPRFDLAITHANVGQVLRDLGRPGEAERHFLEALTLRQRLADEHPTGPSTGPPCPTATTASGGCITACTAGPTANRTSRKPWRSRRR